jgi:hypothetical protein
MVNSGSIFRLLDRERYIDSVNLGTNVVQYTKAIYVCGWRSSLTVFREDIERTQLEVSHLLWIKKLRFTIRTRTGAVSKRFSPMGARTSLAQIDYTSGHGIKRFTPFTLKQAAKES